MMNAYPHENEASLYRQDSLQENVDPRLDQRQTFAHLDANSCDALADHGCNSHADIADLAFVDMVNQSRKGEEDVLGSLWQSNYSIHAGPWNPVAISNNTSPGFYPTYPSGPATEPVMSKHHTLSVVSHDCSDSAYFSSACQNEGLSPNQDEPSPSAYASTEQDASRLLTSSPAQRRRRHSGEAMATHPTLRSRRLSSRSEKALPPCEICIKEGRGRRVPKNYADQKKHGLTHTRPYACLVPGCPRQPSFATQNDLERHARGCHGIETRHGTHHYFKCNVNQCPKQGRIWDRKDNFRQHLQRIHKELELDQIAECLKSAVYHPSSAELRAYHASKKPSSSRRHRPISEYGGTVTTVDDSSTVAGPSDTGTHSPASVSLQQSDYVAGNFGSVDFTMLPPTMPQLDSHWLRGITDMNWTPMSNSRSEVSMPMDPALVEDLMFMEPTSNVDYLQNSPRMDFALDAELAGLLEMDQPDHETNQYIDDTNQPIHQTVIEGFPDAEQRGADEDSLKCSFCGKKVARSCDLTKHEKRHTKPFGCTFPKCIKLFGSKNDWKRHETSVHTSPASWRCNIDGCSSHQPARFFYDQVFIEEHLQKEHDQGKLCQDICEQLRIDATGGDRFWCGFCRCIQSASSDPKNAGLSGAEARLRHIGEHYDQGMDKCEYSCLEMNRGKGYLWRIH